MSDNRKKVTKRALIATIVCYIAAGLIAGVGGPTCLFGLCQEIPSVFSTNEDISACSKIPDPETVLKCVEHPDVPGLVLVDRGVRLF